MEGSTVCRGLNSFIFMNLEQFDNIFTCDCQIQNVDV